MAATDDARGESVRWLTPDEQQGWRAYLRGSRLLDVALDRDLQRHGVTLQEYEILAMLSEAHGDHLRMSALADLVIASRSRLTHTANRLERRGLVARHRALGDRRGIELHLTPAGRTAVESLAPIHVASVRAHLVDHLTPAQFAALSGAMDSIREGILGLDEVTDPP